MLFRRLLYQMKPKRTALDESLDEGFEELLLVASDEAHFETSTGNFTLAVLFDEPAETINTGEAFVAFVPYMLAKSSDVGDVAKGDSVTCQERNWEVIKIQPDGRGVSRIELAEVSS